MEKEEGDRKPQVEVLNPGLLGEMEIKGILVETEKPKPTSEEKKRR